MNNRVIASLSLAIALFGVASAQAAQPCGSCGSNWYPGQWYNVYGTESIPYYALHPPVYYSHPVPRTYGWSPFAYPPGTMTPEIEIVEPQVLKNPHVEPQAAASDDRVAAIQPLRVSNPYAASDVQLSQAE